MNGNADMPMERHKSTDNPCSFQIRDININLSIDQLINCYINGQTKGIEGYISRTSYISTHYLTDISTETCRSLLTDTNLRVIGTVRVYFKSETSIFTYWLINKSIDLSTDRQNGRRDTSVGHQTSGLITWLMYQHRRGDAYWLPKIDGRFMSISNTRNLYSPIDR